MAEKLGESASKSSSGHRPTITLPPRTSMESVFLNGPGFSPGPMTLVSSFFSETDPDSECRSFSQLLAGAIASPTPASAAKKEESVEHGEDTDFNFRLEENRPSGLVIGHSSAAMFTVPVGLSPATLLDSPGFFSSAQGHYGMTHQQALAQVTANATESHSQMQVHRDYQLLSAPPSSSLTQPQSFISNTTAHEQMLPLVTGPSIMAKESSEFSQSDLRSNYSSITVDKPVDDGYNWRKYGQKQVKGSEYPRSYYKCTHPNCPVKKKVERSFEGQVTEIIYKGEHNHQLPQSNKRNKDARKGIGNSNWHGNAESTSQIPSVNSNKVNERVVGNVFRMDQDSSQATQEHQSGSSDNEEEGDAENTANPRDQDEPDPKRRTTEVRVSEPVSSHRTVTEPRIIVQTTSEVDLLDDGYRWRKYGQKVVKGNPYPRSYYKCTTQGCNVRKHVERAASDPKAVITTYEGKHNHDIPTAKNSSHHAANQLQLKPQHVVADTYYSINNTEYENNNQQPIAVLRLKEERIT